MPINTYDKSNTLSTTIKPSGMDIGPIPDFWGDLGAVANRLRPVQQQMGGGQAQAAALQAPAYVNTAAQARENNRDPQAEHLRSMQIRAQLQALDDASRPPPMTYRPASPGTTGGWQMDINAMNANQRRMFLPQQSSFAGEGGGGHGGGGDALRSDTPGLDSINRRWAQADKDNADRITYEHRNDQGLK